MRKIILSLLFFFSISISLFAYQQIETQHTKIIFEEQDQMYAREVASFADEVYENLASYLDYESEGKVPVVMTGKTAWANGYYSPFPASIYMYITSPDNRFIGSRTSSWLKSLYTHELTHYLHLNAKVGPAKVLGFLGPGVNASVRYLCRVGGLKESRRIPKQRLRKGGEGGETHFPLPSHTKYLYRKVRCGAFPKVHTTVRLPPRLAASTSLVT